MKALIKDKNGVSIQEFPYKENPNLPVIKVKSVGLCRTDLLVAEGKIKIDQESIILGHEFSGTIENDPKKIFQKHQLVGVNPLYGQKFMGLDFDGAICEYIQVPYENIIPSKVRNFEKTAYLEPVAASMAVLKGMDTHSIIKDKLSVAITGVNRIATLTKLILRTQGISASILNDEEVKQYHNHFDFIIETNISNDNTDDIFNALKPGKTLILKSRKKQHISIFPSTMVSKEINIKSVNYYSFYDAMDWLSEHHELIAPLLGGTYTLNNWHQAFEKAQKGEDRKIFILLY